MSDVAKWLAVYIINSLWQVPVLAGCTAVALKIAERSGAKLHYRVWVACLLLVLALPALPNVGHVPSFGGHRSGSSSVTIMGNGTKRTSGISDRLAIYADEIAAFAINSKVTQISLWLYSLAFLMGSIRLLRRLALTRAVLRASRPILMPPFISDALHQSEAFFGISPVDVYASDNLNLPATVSWPTAMLLVPTSFESVQEEDVIAAMSHELAHVRRRDFATNLAIETLSLLAFYHPLVHWIKRRIAESREVICDEMAASATTGRTSYARSLLNLAEVACHQPAIPNLSLGVLEGNTLEKRITTLIDARLPLAAPHTVLSTTSCCVVLAALSTGVASLRIQPSAAQIDSSAFAAPTLSMAPATQVQLQANTHVAEGARAQTNYVGARHIGGDIASPKPIYTVEPEFSEEARKAKFMGVVLVNLIVDAQGRPQNVYALRGVGMGLDEKAVDAVKQYRFSAAMENGKPVPVELNVEVSFQIF